jgi:hypothetical protein
MILSASDFNIRDTSDISFAITDAVSVHGIEEAPINFNLAQNYPNPFNPVTTINYQLAKSGHVKLTVFDIRGRIIKTLVNEYQPRGKYKVTFDAVSLSSGIYFYRLELGDFSASRKLILLK